MLLYDGQELLVWNMFLDSQALQDARGRMGPGSIAVRHE